MYANHRYIGQSAARFIQHGSAARGRALMPEGAELEIAAIDAIPLYNADVETGTGIPASVSALKDKIVAADALLLSTPEYNNSIPGVLKNTIDWLSRPPADSQRVFGGRLITIMGASPGPYGTVQSQTAWLPIMRTLRMQPWFGPRLAVAHAASVFDAAGVLTDEKVRAQLREFVQGSFSSWALHAHRSRPSAPESSPAPPAARSRHAARADRAGRRGSRGARRARTPARSSRPRARSTYSRSPSARDRAAL